MKITKLTWMIGICIVLGIAGFVLGSSGTKPLPAFIVCACILLSLVWTLLYGVLNTYREQLKQHDHLPRKVQLVITTEDCKKWGFYFDSDCPLAQKVRQTLCIPDDVKVNVSAEAVAIDGMIVGKIWPWFTLVTYERLKMEEHGEFTTVLEFGPKRELWYE